MFVVWLAVALCLGFCILCCVLVCSLFGVVVLVVCGFGRIGCFGVFCCCGLRVNSVAFCFFVLTYLIAWLRSFCCLICVLIVLWLFAIVLVYGAFAVFWLGWG